MKIKKLFCAGLAACMLAGCLAGCGDKADTATTTDSSSQTGSADTLSSQYTYQATFLPFQMPDGQTIDYVTDFCVIGDQVYLAASYLDGKVQATDEVTGEVIVDETTGEPVEYDNYVSGILVYDLTTQQASIFENFVPADVPEGWNGSSSVNQVFLGADNTIWVYEQTYTYKFDLPENFDSGTDDMYNYYVSGDEQYVLTNFSADGTKNLTINPEVAEDSYISQFFAMNDGRILGYNYENAYIFDQDGKLSKTIDVSSYSGQLCQMTDGSFAVQYYDDTTSQQKMKKLDLETGEFTDYVTVPSMTSSLHAGFGDYEFVYQLSDAVFGMKKDATEGERLFAWLDCDVNSNNVGKYYFQEDGTVIAVETDYTSGTNTSTLVIMKQVDASEVKEKTILTLGCMSLDWNLRSNIIAFNRSNDSVRIEVTDYSESVSTDDYDTATSAALQKLNTEILSGNMPDILCTDGLPVQQYAAKGLLEDLWPMIDSDETLSRDSLMEHFFDVISDDGKLYQVTNSFVIQTAATYTEIADGRTSWTLSELLDALHNLKEGATIFGDTDTSGNMLQTLVSFNLDSFMDWENNTCSFDSQEFIDILNFAAQFPQEFDYSSYDWDSSESPYTRMKNGKQLMYATYVYSFDEIQVDTAMLDNRCSYIGYPSESGNGSSFSFSGGLAITSSCKDKEAAWSLVRTVLLEENQTANNVYCFPTNKNAFEAAKKTAMTAEYTTDPDTGEQVEISKGGVGYDDFTLELYALKQSDFDAFWTLYENCNSVVSTNTDVTNMIIDQAAAFLDGTKTAEETAKLIQDQISLYMMEQG